MVQISNYNDGRDTYEEFWQDFVTGFRSWGQLVSSVQEKQGLTYGEAQRFVSNLLFEGRCPEYRSVSMTPEELPYVDPGEVNGAEATKRILLSVVEVGSERAIKVTALVAQAPVRHRTRAGEWTTVPAKDRWVTLGLVAEHCFGDEDILTALTTAESYLRVVRRQVVEDDAEVNDGGIDVDEAAALEALQDVLG